MWFPEYFKRLLTNRVDSNLTIADIDYSNDTILAQLRIYQDTLYIALATFPGMIAGILLIGLTGGKILLGKIATRNRSTPLQTPLPLEDSVVSNPLPPFHSQEWIQRVVVVVGGGGGGASSWLLMHANPLDSWNSASISRFLK